MAAAFLVFVPDLAEKISKEWTGVLYGAVMLASVYVHGWKICVSGEVLERPTR